MSQTLANRIALVTGASRGIGRALARELDDEVRAFGQEATLVPCDLKDFDALDRLGRAIHDRWGKLDILVANAGMLGPVTPLSHIDPQAWADSMAVNVTANYRLIRSLDPLLRASDAGRVVAISANAGSRADMQAYRGLYATCKAALDAMMRTYAAETATTSNVKVMLVNPGYVRTKMRAQLMPGEDPETLPTPEHIAPKLAMLCTPEWTETGKLYELPAGVLKSFRAPE